MCVKFVRIVLCTYLLSFSRLAIKSLCKQMSTMTYQNMRERERAQTFTQLYYTLQVKNCFCITSEDTCIIHKKNILGMAVFHAKAEIYTHK